MRVGGVQWGLPGPKLQAPKAATIRTVSRRWCTTTLHAQRCCSTRPHCCYTWPSAAVAPGPTSGYPTAATPGLVHEPVHVFFCFFFCKAHLWYTSSMGSWVKTMMRAAVYTCLAARMMALKMEKVASVHTCGEGWRQADSGKLVMASAVGGNAGGDDGAIPASRPLSRRALLSRIEAHNRIEPHHEGEDGLKQAPARLVLALVKVEAVVAPHQLRAVDR